MIWLIGAEGMLGKALAEEFGRRRLNYVATDREVDITDIWVLRRFAAEHRFKWFINAAAYTAVDRAEAEEQTAHLINALGPANIGQVAKEQDGRVIHFSTDYVFSGEQSTPYAEEDPTGPLSAYGRTKLTGETGLIAATEQHYIFRISGLYGHHGNNFVSTMLRLFNERDRVTVVADQYAAPTQASALAANIANLVSGQDCADHSTRFGLYHYTDQGKLTWFDLAQAIYEEALQLGLIDRQIAVVPISVSDYPYLAKRPRYSLLRTERVTQLNFQLFPWRDNLRQHLQKTADRWAA